MTKCYLLAAIEDFRTMWERQDSEIIEIVENIRRIKQLVGYQEPTVRRRRKAA